MIMSAKYYEAPPQDIEHLYDEKDGVWSLKDEVAITELEDEETAGIIAHHNSARHEAYEELVKASCEDDDLDLRPGAWLEMPVGDVNSDEKGTGARALGADKVPMQWVPVRFWLELFKQHANELRNEMPLEDIGGLLSCVQALAEFQEGKASGQEMMRQLGPVMLEEAAKVFDYGANKYKAWNWLKGMPWSIPVGCALRHMKAIFIDQEFTDGESLLPHTGHFACNIIMLATYDVMYQEGNDLPPEELWQ